MMEPSTLMALIARSQPIRARIEALLRAQWWADSAADPNKGINHMDAYVWAIAADAPLRKQVQTHITDAAPTDSAVEDALATITDAQLCPVLARVDARLKP